jgi:NADH-quinone oxidoreductase subunit J
VQAAFYLASAVAILATSLAIVARNAIHALLYFILSLLASAAIFWILGAPFVAVVEIIIYAGAIMVLFVFAVMIIGLDAEALAQERRWLSPRAAVLPGALALLLGVAVISSFDPSTAISVTEVGAREVSRTLIGPHLLGIEIASLLLLAALLAACFIATKEPRR